MKLTLEHLAGYLPYGLKGVDYFQGHTLIRDITVNNVMSIVDGDTKLKPILRPLSDLTKEIEVNGEKFVPMKRLKNGGTDLNEYRFIEWKGYSAIDNEEHETCYCPETMSFYQFYMGDSRMCSNQYEKMQLLLSWHFDIHGLIDQGLAIDINTL